MRRLNNQHARGVVTLDSEFRLDADQVGFFKAHGYLILENLIDGDTLTFWREQIWEALSVRPEAPETWPDRHKLNDFQFGPPGNQPTHYPTYQTIGNQLGGGDFCRGPDDHVGGGAPILNWPKPEQAETWSIPASGHIDGYAPHIGQPHVPFMVGFTTYLNDVASRGGAFTFWPGSHLTTHRYFLEHPDEIAGSFRRHSRPIFSDIAPESSREFTGKAGDVLLWHSYLCHSGSVNVHPSPRFAVVVRYAHRLKKDPAFKLEVPEDLWEYWAI
jgi:hypothetical protein